MSGPPPPPAPPASGGSPSPRAAGSVVRTASSSGIGIWSVPPTSPPRLAADPPALGCRRLSSTVGPAWCRHGVTDAATCMTSGGVGPAWPRATPRTILRPVGVACHASPTWRLARIKQRRPTGQTLPERALDRPVRERLAVGCQLGQLVRRVGARRGCVDDHVQGGVVVHD